MRLYNINSCTPQAFGGKKSSPQNYLPTKQSADSSKWHKAGYRQPHSADKNSLQGIKRVKEQGEKEVEHSGSPNNMTFTAEVTPPNDHVDSSHTASQFKPKVSVGDRIVVQNLPTPKNLTYILRKENSAQGDQQNGATLASQCDESSLTTPSVLSQDCKNIGNQSINDPTFEAGSSFTADSPLSTSLSTQFSIYGEYSGITHDSKPYQDFKLQELSWPSELLSLPKDLLSDKDKLTFSKKRGHFSTVRSGFDEQYSFESKDAKIPTQKARLGQEKKEKHEEKTDDVLSEVINDFQPFECTDRTNTPIGFNSPAAFIKSNYPKNTSVDPGMDYTNAPFSSKLEAGVSSPESTMFRFIEHHSVISPTKGYASTTSYNIKEQSILNESEDDPQDAKHLNMLNVEIPTGGAQKEIGRCGKDIFIVEGSELVSRGSSSTSSTAVEGKNMHASCIKWDVHEFTSSNSIWALCKHDPDVANFTIDKAEIKSLFSSINGVDNRGPIMGNGDCYGASRVIDTKRAKNCEAVLARIALSHSEISRAIENIDQDAMRSEEVRGILDFIPTVDERSALRSYLEEPKNTLKTLSECEKFMIAIMPVKNAKKKLDAILFVQSFPCHLEGLRRDVRFIQKSCDEIIGSGRFRKILGIILFLGNQLNSVSGKKMANAFSVNSLLKLKDVKGFDGTNTFLHVVVSSILRRKASLIHFQEEMPSLYYVEKGNWAAALSQMRELEKGLDEVRKISLEHSQKKLMAEGTMTTKSSISLSREVKLLKLTPVGRFTLDACLRMTALVSEIDKAKDQLNALLRYFEEENVFDGQPDEIFRSMCEFGRDFDAALHDVIHEEKMKVRKFSCLESLISLFSHESFPNVQDKRGIKSSIYKYNEVI